VKPLAVVVTGASGFIGRHLILRAGVEGIDVEGVVRSEKGVQSVVRVGGRPARVQALEPEALLPVFKGKDAVVHLAQIGAERGGQTYRSVNVEGTRAVVEAARRAGVPRLVYLSGLGVARYGQSIRCTNPYFLSKLVAETALYVSGLEVTVFRPSYVVGAGDGFVSRLASDIAKGQVELPGHGSQKMQPVAVLDAAEAVFAAVRRKTPWPVALDLVGPESIACFALVERLAGELRRAGRPSLYSLSSIAEKEADRRAESGGYGGMLPDELDCMLCGEVADPRPLEALLGRFLTPLDAALAAAVRGLSGPESRG